MMSALILKNNLSEILFTKKIMKTKINDDKLNYDDYEAKDFNDKEIPKVASDLIMLV